MGSSSEGYQGGTVYYSEFTGQFSPLTKISDTEYSLTVASVALENEPDTQEIIDEMLYIYTEAVGIGEGDEFRLYLPDMPISELSEDYLSWARQALSEDAETLGIYGLYNTTEGAGFMGDSAEAEISVDLAPDEITGEYDFFEDEYEGYDPVKIIFRTNVTVKDFKFIAIEPDDEAEGAEYTETAVLYSLDELSPEKPLVVTWLEIGLMPHRGISFTDENGSEKYFYLAQSGEDGYLLLIEF
jgi:hypothetical protein